MWKYIKYFLLFCLALFLFLEASYVLAGIALIISIILAFKLYKISKHNKQDPSNKISYQIKPLSFIGKENTFDIRLILTASILSFAICLLAGDLWASHNKEEALRKQQESEQQAWQLQLEEKAKQEELARQEELKKEEEAEKAKRKEEAKKIVSTHEEAAEFAFGKDVKCDVIEGWGDDEKPKITRVNITISGEPMIDPFLGRIFTYLKKAKEANLDYESVFFILRSEKTDGKEYPYAKVEITKEAADKFDFDNKSPQDLKDIAKTYDAPDAKKATEKNSTNTTNNDDTKKALTAYTKTFFKDNYDVEIEEANNTYMVHLYPKDPDFKEEIAMLMLDPTNPQLLQGWEHMTQNLLSASKSMKEKINENVSISIHNPSNPEAILLTVFNDFVFQDFIKGDY